MEKCNDKNCPKHGTIKLHGRTFTGTVIASRAHKTATVEWERRHFVSKYDRYEKRRTRVKAHNPQCIDAKEGEIVQVIECRPLSKTKNFVIAEKVGINPLFAEQWAGREAAKKKSEKEKEPEAKKPQAKKNPEVKEE